MNEAMTKCPQFKECNANKCLLDNFYHLRNKLEDDDKCKISKSTRLKIGKEYELPKLGMTDREFAHYQNWKNKSEREKMKSLCAEMGTSAQWLPEENHLKIEI